MQSLPPFRLAPYFSKRIWGFEDLEPWFHLRSVGDPIGEAWLTGDQCLVETGPLAGLALKDVAAKYGPQLLGDANDERGFPLLIKVLFPKEKLSVQVHPDDAMAQKYGDPRGKTECWYALDAQPGSAVALGLNSEADPTEIRKAIQENRLEEYLNWVPVQKGDMIFVDAGTVHAIGPGLVILETQQNSDLTYRMYDYGRPRELHLERSLEAMRMSTRAGKVQPKEEADHTLLIDARYFRVERYELGGRDTGAQFSTEAQSPTMQIFFVASGRARIEGDGFDSMALERCQVAVIPAMATSWRLVVEEPMELMRILPR
jgi:mannose-6-phosphate isomerase